MVDIHLPIEERERALRSLFLDFNSYFASVEQQEDPSLRGRPMAVAPMLADTTCVIASSYEAKRLGIRCGTMVREAKEICPEIVILPARPSLYVSYHKRILEVVETVLHIEEVCSIDEMRFGLMGEEKNPDVARRLATDIKEAVRDSVGEQMTCSVGIAPNKFLAKLATELQKPNGLVVIEAKDLPHRLHELKLTDFTGINKRTAIRLNSKGIFTAKDLCGASRAHLLDGFGSIIGEKWWYLLRGYDLGDEHQDKKSLGHSHILPPELRTDQGCREVILRLLQKASARLRASNLWTTDMSISVKGMRKSWRSAVKLPATQDTVTMNEHFLRLWESRDFELPLGVGVHFTGLCTPQTFTPSLFEPVVERAEFNHAIDKVNQKFGKNSVFLAGMEKAKDSADEKIAFNKTWLFSEGKGDNEWVDTFRGLVD